MVQSESLKNILSSETRKLSMTACLDLECEMKLNHKQQYHDEIKQRCDLRVMTDSELERVHQIYLEMAKDLFEMFDSCGIRATLGGGSVLGAVRHKGFIPWDDDMDFNMPRRDFEKLKEVFDGYFHGKYIFSAPNHTLHSGYRCGKIANPRVQVWDETGRKHGLTIDVFIVENLPDSSIIRFLRGLRSELYRIIAGLAFEYECSRNDGNRNIAVSLKRNICYFTGWLFSFRTSMKWYDILDHINQYPNENTKMVFIPNGSKHYYGEIHPREALTESISMPFESLYLPIPKGYDRYLKALYGDYSLIPTEEQREHHYIHCIDFI